MTDPYRDQRLACPACRAPLREFNTRQVCDACDGMLLALADLSAAIHDLTSIVPTFEYKDEKPGKRACPKCSAAMTTCKLRVSLDGEVEKVRAELDRCAEHGIWFDGEELAKVFEKVAGKGFGGGVGRTGPKKSGPGGADRGSGGWRGRSGVPEWWGGGGGGSW